jgi:hypothetical protein
LPAPSYDYVRAWSSKGASEELALGKACDAYLDDRAGAGAEPHAERVFGRLLPPFELAYEEGAKSLDETEFHRLAFGIFEAAIAGSTVADGG